MKKLCLILAVFLGLLCVPAQALTEGEKEAALYEAGLAALEQCVEESMTDVEKITALHDWMSLRCDYGLSPNGQTAYGAVVEGAAVCTGYADGFAFMAELAGLEGVSTYSAAVDHAWILATLDGERYFCDCTWDDGKNAKIGLIRHKYMLFNEENAVETNRVGWDSTESVPGGPLENVPWTEAVTRVIFDGDYAWYIDGEFRLIRCDRATWERSVLLDFEDRWFVWEDNSMVYTELYSGLVLIRDRLYFNTPWAIYSVDTEGEHLKIEVTPDTTEGYIYGIAVREGDLCYSLATGPDDLNYEILDSGIFCWGAWGCDNSTDYLWKNLKKLMG